MLPRQHPVSRRALLAGAAAMPAGALLGACSSEQTSVTRSARDEITYLTGIGMFGREAYVHLAHARGYFADEGLTVDIQPGEAGEKAAEQLAGGRVQFAAVDSSGVIIRHGLGEDTDTVIVSAVQQQTTAAILSTTIDRPAGLEGGTTTVDHPTGLDGAVIGGIEGSIIETLFPAYAQLAGFDASLITFEPLGAADLAPNLVAGNVDAIGLFLVGQPLVEAAAGGREVHILPYSDVLLDLYGTVHVTSRRIAEQEPDLVARFNRAITRGLVEAVADPEAAGVILAEQEKAADAEIAAAELALMAPYVTDGVTTVGAMDRQRVARMIATLEGVGAVPPGVAPADVVAFDLLPGAE